VGETRVDVQVCGIKSCKELKNVLVDTGALTTVISRKVADDLNLVPLVEHEFITVKGKVKMPVAVADIQLLNKKVSTPVLISEEDVNLVGAFTLQVARFKVNPITETLEEIKEPLTI